MAPEESLQEHLRELEERLLRPEVRRSPQELAQLLADDFREFGSSGRIFDKEQIIEALQNEEPSELRLEEFRLVALTLESALATYRATRKAVPTGTESHSLRSSVWRKQNGRWQVVFHQGTPAK